MKDRERRKRSYACYCLQHIKGLPKHLYMYNLLSSPSLFTELANNDTGACGTLRTNRRGVPDQIHRHKPKKDHPALVMKEDRLTYISWADKRPVKVVNSIHNGATFRKRVRSKHGGNNRRTYMGGVDLADQMMWHSLNIHRSCKWWNKIFLAVLEVCLCNTMIIVRALNNAKPA
ncbi:uncharacterized protein LOC135157997 [Lytechinus pictus]|uniref:uncharacterized protein LOC135157997 n=1 Tax=Lytechinus pictus TaxID=7653 RepID=UPI0030B9DDDE